MNWSSMRQSKVLVSRVAACSVIAAVLFAEAAQTASQAHYQHGLKRGPAPGGAEQATFSIHRLGTDHAEGLTTLDMNGDGRPDILSGAYWYENPGPQGGEWKRQQYRQADVLAEFPDHQSAQAVEIGDEDFFRRRAVDGGDERLVEVDERLHQARLGFPPPGQCHKSGCARSRRGRRLDGVQAAPGSFGLGAFSCREGAC